MAGIAKYAFALTVFLGGLVCGIGAASSIRVKSVQLRPEKELYLSGDVIFHCEVVKDENGLQSIQSVPLQVRYHRNGKVWKDTGSPKKNVQLMYVDNTDMVDVVCYIQTQSTTSKVIKYKAVKKPPVFVLVPNKPTYGIGERIMACRIIHTGGNIEENCPFYMEVIDSITKQIIWDSISYVRSAEIPWIMREYKSLLRITCKGGEMEVGPKTIEVTTAKFLLTKPATGAVVNDGDIALCLTAGNAQAHSITWVYLAGERLHIKGRELHIRAGKLSSTVDRPTTAIYACVGDFDYGMKYIVVIYQIASLISLKLVPQSDIYAVGQKVGCSYRSQLIDSDDVSYDITDGVEACVHLVYKNDRPKEVKCGKLTTIIPEAHFSLRDYQLVCTKHQLESTPVPLKVLYDRETHLSPDKITFLPDERIQCDRTKYEDNYTPLYIVKVTVGAEFHIYESNLDITEVLSRFPAVWYNVTDIMPHDDFRPDLQVLIAFCDVAGKFTQPIYINQGRSEDLKIQQIFPTQQTTTTEEVLVLPETTFKCTYESKQANVAWRCINCHPDDYQIVEHALLIIRRSPFDKRIEYACVAQTGRIAANNPRKLLRMVVVSNFYIMAGSEEIFQLAGTLVQCHARGLSTITKKKFSIDLDALLFTFNPADRTWKTIGSGPEAFALDASVKHYAECIYGRRRRTAKKPVYVFTYKDLVNGSVTPSNSSDALAGARIQTGFRHNGVHYSGHTILQYRPVARTKDDDEFLTYPVGLMATLPDYFDYQGRLLRPKDVEMIIIGVGYGNVYVNNTNFSLPECHDAVKLRVAPNEVPLFQVGEYLFCEGEELCATPKSLLWISQPRTEDPISDNFSIDPYTPPLRITQEMTGFFKAACTPKKKGDLQSLVRKAEKKTIIVPTLPHDFQVEGASEQITPPSLIRCSAKGYPRPIIQWIQIAGPSELQIDNNGRIIIQSWDMAGTYTCLCFATNGQGKAHITVTFTIKNPFWFRMENTKEFIKAVVYGVITFVLATMFAVPVLRRGNWHYYF